MLPQTDRYLFQYRKFTGSHHFYHGLLATLAIVSPVLISGYFGYGHLGLAMALGALCLTIVDNPGPLHHRRNARQTCRQQVAARANKLFLQTGCNSDELRGKNCSRTLFHLEANNTMYVRTVGRELLRQNMVKGKRWMAFTAE